MGQIRRKKIVVLIICLLLTGILCNLPKTLTTAKKAIPLKKALIDITGWHYNGFSKLDTKIVEALYLDDYANQSYTKNGQTVFLYVGYYLSKKKVGAAHDPMVCFSGQGWLLKDKKTKKFVLNAKTDEKISYSSMLAERSGAKEFVVYWFQSYDKTNPGTFSQKLTLLWSKFLGKGVDNAFVRITMRIDEKSAPECEETINEFIKVFYPVFLEYVVSG